MKQSNLLCYVTLYYYRLYIPYYWSKSTCSEVSCLFLSSTASIEGGKVGRSQSTRSAEVRVHRELISSFSFIGLVKGPVLHRLDVFSKGLACDRCFKGQVSSKVQLFQSSNISVHSH